MKFVFSDSLDFVDPNYDFLEDRHAPGRQPYWDDYYPHELLGYAPYQGMLVSRAIVGDHRLPGKYSESQAMRFRRVGARAFLRLESAAYADQMLMGDCGAFSYCNMEEPPYSPQDTVEFYGDGRFTHGCAIDHIVFDFDPEAQGLEGGTPEARRRFDITLDLASEFLAASRVLGPKFTPVGVVQGWSPGSMAEAARRLLAMGYRYLAIGGLVPLKTEQIHRAVAAVDEVVRNRSDSCIHLLGFAKADDIGQFSKYRIASFDTTSPLIRAFKDAQRNYFLRDAQGRMQYFTAIRIPDALENSVLQRQAKMGRLHQESLLGLEAAALSAIRRYSRREADAEPALDALIEYARPFQSTSCSSEGKLDLRLRRLREQYARTLNARPWEQCECAVCVRASVDVVIFRGSNRNKRRGIHNLAVFGQHLRENWGS